jgi:aminocarboxymuconate-semialdehyde decarboxylase
MPDKIVDIHSHIYPELYLKYMTERTSEPYVREVDGKRMFVIFPGESGRPMDETYWDVDEKLKFMDTFGIDQTVLSLGNPWLDPINGPESVSLAQQVNDYFASLPDATNGRISGMGVLPSSSVEDSVAAVHYIAGKPLLRGVIVGSRICGLALDDAALGPLWQALNDTEVPVLLHPHYGVALDLMEGYGHVLPLALAFTFETTTALSRLVLSGVLTRMPGLKIVGSHGGGTLPFLAGRIDGCWRPDSTAREISPNLPSEAMRQLYLDALVYDPRSLKAVADLVGADHMAFGTDHPFSIADPVENLEAIRRSFSESEVRSILSGTATRLYGLSDA